jgi:DNA repair exonuclease SbcCD nuclease subunit
MFRFLHAADIHLDSPMLGLERYPGVPVDDARLATRRALDNLVDLAIEESVSFVLIAGDVYDGDWRDFNTGLYFNQAMLRLRDSGIQAFVVAGNHDAENKIQSHLRWPENVHWFSTKKPETRRLPKIGVAVHGQGYSSAEMQDNLAAGFPAADPSLFNIGLLHTALDGRHGHGRYAPCTLRDLESKRYDYWALGHVHEKVIVSKDPWVVFPGSTQGRNVSEPGAKGCMVVTVNDGKVGPVDWHALDVMRWAVCDVDVADCRKPDDVVHRVGKVIEEACHEAEGRMVAARVQLIGSCEAHADLIRDRDRWANEIRQIATDRSKGNAWIEKVKVSTSPVMSLEDIRRRDDPLGDLVRSIERMEQDTDPIASLLAEAGDLAEDLGELRRLLEGAGLAGFASATKGTLIDIKHDLIARLLTVGNE